MRGCPRRPVGRAHEATASVRGRFSALGNGIRLLAVAGLAPMLLFCLVFLLSRQVEVGVAGGAASARGSASTSVTR